MKDSGAAPPGPSAGDDAFVPQSAEERARLLLAQHKLLEKKWRGLDESGDISSLTGKSGILNGSAGNSLPTPAPRDT